MYAYSFGICMHILFFPNEYAEYAYIFKKAGKFKTEHGAGESKDDDKGISTVPEKKKKKIEKKKTGAEHGAGECKDDDKGVNTVPRVCKVA